MSLNAEQHERIARSESTCRGCGGPKEVGLIVCWTCFKYHPTDPMGGYKYFPSCDLNEWLESVGIVERQIV